MKKQEFLCALKKRLSCLPKQEAQERLNFYSEMIDDRMEEGLSEEEAVFAVGPIDEIVSQISEEINLTSTQKDTKPQRKLCAWETALLILGAPLWIPLLIAAFAVIFSLYAILWTVNICLWAVEAPFFIFSLISKYLFAICKKATKYSVTFTRKSVYYIKKIFSTKGGLNR